MLGELPVADRHRGLVGEVRRYTERASPDGHIVGLYVYGSAVRGEADHWSDLDVCAVYAASEAAHASSKRWAQGLLDGFAGQVDPLNVPVDRLGADVCWWWALTLRDLKASSRLLMGRDVRAKMGDASEHKVRLGSSWGAGCMLRRVYGIGGAQTLPAAPFPLPPVDEGVCDPKDLYRACIQLLRAILLLERGSFPFSQPSIPHEALGLGETRLAEIAGDALALRRAASAGHSQCEWQPPMGRLMHALPHLAERWLRALERHGLEDPSYEPAGNWRYNGDGTPCF